jgi:glycosyltransferase involved in cell wall biosynthesis
MLINPRFGSNVIAPSNLRMPSPAVSFVLPVYNARDDVADAVRSVLAQTWTDFELLLIDDGSTDGSGDVLRSFNDPRIRVLTQENRGLVPTLNRGIEEARGTWIARMDSDDLCLPHRLQKQMDYLAANPDIALLGGWVATIDEGGALLADVVPFPVSHEELWSTIGRRPWVMCHPAVIFRRDAAIDVGLYHPAYKHAEDAEFFARMMTRYRAANLPEVVLKYRLRPGAVSGAFKDFGRVNAELVRKIIDRWKPGEPFAATPQERAEADALIAASHKKVGPRDVAATYHCRRGRELLRGARWGRALLAYGRAALATPLRAEVYKGMGAALLHAGAAPAAYRHAATAALLACG